MDKIYKRAQRRAGMTVAQMPLVILIACVIAVTSLYPIIRYTEFDLQSLLAKLFYVVLVFFFCECVAFLIGWSATPDYLYTVNKDKLRKNRRIIRRLKRNPYPMEDSNFSQYKARLKMLELKHADLAAEKGRLTMRTKSQA